MADAQNMSIVTELIKEVESYLPDIKELLSALVDDPSDHEAGLELRRLFHTIKGAALMVGLGNLGNSAGLLENILDDFVDQQAPLPVHFIEATSQTIDKIGVYCGSLNEKEDDGEELYRSTQTAFRRYVGSSAATREIESEQEKEDVLFPDFDEDDDDEVVDDFFQQLSGEEEKGGDDFAAILADENDEDDFIFSLDEENEEDDSVLEALLENEDELVEVPVGQRDQLVTVIDPELQECFKEETEEHLENIGHQLNQLSASVDGVVNLDEQLQEGLHSLRRSVHTLKGAAAVIGIQAVADWGHEYEDFLDWLHDDARVLSPDIMGILFEGSDLLEQLSDDPGADVTKDITRIKSHFTAVMAAPPAPADPIEDIEPEQDDFEALLATTAGDDDSVADFETDIFLSRDAQDLPPDATESVSPTNNKGLSSLIDPELQECFKEETEEHLENIGQQLNQLSASVDGVVNLDEQLQEGLHSLRRSVHTLKGAAAVIGIQAVADWGHEYEDFLDWLHDDARVLSPDIMGILFEGSDLLEQLSDDPGADVTKDITRIKSHFAAVMAAPPAPAGDDDSNDDLQGDIVSMQNESDVSSGSIESLPSSESTNAFSFIDPELQESFKEEAEEHLENISSELNVLSSLVSGNISKNTEHLEKIHSIRRSVHTLKGAAAVIGIEPVAAWGHSFEDFLDWLHDDVDMLSPAIISLMFDGTELLEGLAENPDKAVTEEINKLEGAFLAIMEAPADYLEEEPEPHNDSPAIVASKESIAEIGSSRDFSSNKTKKNDVIEPEIHTIFHEEAEEYLENIGRQLNELSSSREGGDINNEEGLARIRSIRHSVHALKGAAMVAGITTIAECGHVFEDFLDVLHEKSGDVSTNIINALLECSDILDQIATDPARITGDEVARVRNVCRAVTDDSLPLSPTVQADQSTDTGGKSLAEDKLSRKSDSIFFAGKKDKQTVTRRRTLRVEVDKIAEVMGLSGDMSINLSTFENSLVSMNFNLHEFEMTLQRLKSISSSLETGYEMSSLPHLGVVGGGVQDGSTVADEFDPLEMDRYSELHILIRSLNEAVVDLESIKDQSFVVENEWRTAIDRQRGIVTEVQGAVRAIQMTPFSTLANRLYKTVRESARATKKKVRLLIEGGALEMDTHVWDVLADALMHMLRNSVDHGVESAETRLAGGKPEQATIRIACSRQGSRFVLRLSDDGSGLDYDAIRKRAQDLFPDLNVLDMKEKDLGALIFRQGFSVRTQVTNISGRGVGMDVVSNAIANLNGTIEVVSRPGEGTDFILSMPIVVAQLPALLVRFGNETFAVPMRDIARVLRMTDEDREKDTYELDGTVLPVLNPVDLLCLQSAARQQFDTEAYLSSLALVVETAGRQAIVLTDAVLGQMDIVFKSLGSHLKNVPCVAGATIMGDGGLVPILQTEDLFEIEKVTDKPADKFEKATEKERDTLHILIVDDSISIRKVLTNFISRNGWKPKTAFDGVDAMERIRESKPDLIISDIEMPRMNGFELLQSLQAQSAYRDIPVLMLTSRSANKYVEKATQLGARGFVTKPFKDHELLGLINGLFS